MVGEAGRVEMGGYVLKVDWVWGDDGLGLVEMVGMVVSLVRMVRLVNIRIVCEMFILLCIMADDCWGKECFRREAGLVLMVVDYFGMGDGVVVVKGFVVLYQVWKSVVVEIVVIEVVKVFVVVGQLYFWFERICNIYHPIKFKFGFFFFNFINF